MRKDRIGKDKTQILKQANRKWKKKRKEIIQQRNGLRKLKDRKLKKDGKRLANKYQAKIFK